MVFALTIFFAVMAHIEVSGAQATEAQVKVADGYTQGWHMCLTGLIGLIGGKSIP